MDATELLLIATRWLHTIAAVIWIGAVFFELLALRPAFGGDLPPAADATVASVTREIVQSSLIVFLASGAILTFDRLSSRAATTTYVMILVLKVVLAVVMFQLAFRLRRAAGSRRLVGLRWMAALGLAILFLAALLKSIYERALLA